MTKIEGSIDSRGATNCVCLALIFVYIDEKKPPFSLLMCFKIAAKWNHIRYSKQQRILKLIHYLFMITTEQQTNSMSFVNPKLLVGSSRNDFFKSQGALLYTNVIQRLSMLGTSAADSQRRFSKLGKVSLCLLESSVA